MHTVAVEAGEERFRLECGHVSLTRRESAAPRAGQPEREERRVGLEPLFWRPGEPLHDSASIVRVFVVLPNERVAQDLGVWR